MKRRRIISVLTVVLVFIGLLLVKVAIWVPETFGDIPFEQVLFHVMVLNITDGQAHPIR